MPEFNVEVEFDVYCGTCGAPLCPQSSTHDYERHKARSVTVDVCQKCVDAAYEDGYNRGYDDGVEEAIDAG